MENRIGSTFERLNAANRTALIAFIMAGDPDAARSLSVLNALPEAGADLIELGMPFTDPAADGVTIQQAGQRALKAGASMKMTLQMVRDFRKGNDRTPIILMGYANPLYAYGLEAFTKDAKAAGVDGLIVVDLPPEEDEDLRRLTDAQGIHIIRLVTPTTDATRLERVLDGAGGFLYYVSVTGVTGGAQANREAIKPHTEMIRARSNLPLAIGFGIKTPNDAQEMSAFGDAVVVGSAIVDKVKDIGPDGAGQDDVTRFVETLSDALGPRPLPQTD